jgi:hypothetical protein
MPPRNAERAKRKGMIKRGGSGAPTSAAVADEQLDRQPHKGVRRNRSRPPGGEAR